MCSYYATEVREIYSSDFAMQFALAARGYTIMPWNESAQMHEDKEIPLSGPKDAAFRHYSGPVGKPTYELKLQQEDSKLAKERPAKYQGKDPNCQVCYSFQRYVQLWGSPKCTNSLPFEYSDLMLKRYHPNLAKEPCHPDIGSLCEPHKLHPRYAVNAVNTTTTTAAPAAEVSGSGRKLYGFYLHVFHSPAAVFYQVRKLKEVFPGSPIYVMSDGGADFSPFCEQEGCTFKMCPPANDRWHPWPFFRRLYDAAVSLNTEFVIMIHGPIKHRPKYDAGGLLVRDRSFAGADYVEKLARKRVTDYRWTKKNQQAGLCGGSYYKREAILDALSDERMAQLDWNFLGERFTKEIYSSDFALQYALAARGWTIMPWEEAAQMHDSKEIPLAGPKDAAFRHYSGPVGKPTYEMKLRKEDVRLVKDQPAKFRGKDSNCQLCYNLTRYVEIYGSSDCTNEVPFTYSGLLLERYHPELKTRMCQPSRGAINIVEGIWQEGQLRGSEVGERGSEDEEEERADLARYGKNWQKVRRAVEAGFALKDLLQDVRESQTNSLYDRDWNRPQFGGSIKLMGPRSLEIWDFVGTSVTQAQSRDNVPPQALAQAASAFLIKEPV
eukprot:s3229_g7.t3